MNSLLKHSAFWLQTLFVITITVIYYNNDIGNIFNTDNILNNIFNQFLPPTCTYKHSSSRYFGRVLILGFNMTK